VRKRKRIKTGKNDKYKRKAVKAGNIDLDLTTFFSIHKIVFEEKKDVNHKKKNDSFM
jgi:hypothetical protein